MSTWMIWVGIAVVLLLLVVYVVGIYNNLVAYRNNFKNAFAQIEVQLKRRLDLIPNLIEVVKGAMAHERETLEAVIAARNSSASKLNALSANVGNPEAIAAFANAEEGLTSALSRFNVVMEAYPNITATTNSGQLSEELTSTENKISFARQGYNDSVLTYNNYRESFPQVVFAGMFGHGTSAGLLEYADKEKLAEAPKVSF